MTLRWMVSEQFGKGARSGGEEIPGIAVDLCARMVAYWETVRLTPARSFMRDPVDFPRFGVGSGPE